jgi:hypothetical protein
MCSPSGVVLALHPRAAISRDLQCRDGDSGKLRLVAQADACFLNRKQRYLPLQKIRLSTNHRFFGT